MLKKKSISGILILTLLTIGLNVSFADNIPLQNNKEIATEFLESIVNTKDFDAASRLRIGNFHKNPKTYLFTDSYDVFLNFICRIS